MEVSHDRRTGVRLLFCQAKRLWVLTEFVALLLPSYHYHHGSEGLWLIFSPLCEYLRTKVPSPLIGGWNDCKHYIN